MVPISIQINLLKPNVCLHNKSNFRKLFPEHCYPSVNKPTRILLYLSRSVNKLKINSKAAFTYSDKRDFGKLTRSHRLSTISDLDMLIGNRIDACAVIRKSAWEHVGGYCEDLVDGYEDWDLWLNFIRHGFTRIHIPEFLFEYRVRSGSLLSILSASSFFLK